MDLEESYKQNLIERVMMREGCEKDPLKQAAALELLRRKDDGVIYFFKYWMWTFDPRKAPSDRAFIPWLYQEEYIKELNADIAAGVSQLTEKTRDMGATWMVLGVFVYRWLVFNENFLLGSRKQEYVDTIGDMKTHFERCRYILGKLPDWMVEAFGWNRGNDGFMKIYKYNGASLVGEAMTPHFSRQGRFKAILLDEFAFVDKSELVWRACGDSAPCKIPVSTPNGKNNFFCRLRYSGKIKVKTLHWTLHPHKDKSWYEREKVDRSEKDVAQELDINYTVSAGTPFYKGFIRSLHYRPMKLNPAKPLILAFDYGFGHPNCSIHQIDLEGRWIVFDNIFGTDVLIDAFGDHVKDYLSINYPGYSISRAFGDPAGTAHSDKSKVSSQQILRNKGFPVTSLPSNLPTTNYTARKNIIEKKLRTLIGGIPALIVNECENNEIIAEGFEGGYRYPDENKYGGVAEKPVEDGWFEHPMNTVEYFAVNMFKPVTRDDSHTKALRAKHANIPRQTNAGFGFARR